MERDARKDVFAKRLAALRESKGVSARDMSLTLGQSAGYINNIETCVNYPSMAVFFCICDYLGITPKEFFDTELDEPAKVHELLNTVQGLSGGQIDVLISVAEGFERPKP